MNAPQKTIAKKKHYAGSLAVGIVSALLLGLFSSESASGHGTIGKVVKERAVCILFTYDDDLPMEYAKVNIKAKGNDFPYQTGGTDKNGRFCFIPDHEDLWTIVANDGMGHQQELSVQANTEIFSTDMKTADATTKSGNSRIAKGLYGLSIIFGFTGIVAWYRSRKKASSNE